MEWYRIAALIFLIAFLALAFSGLTFDDIADWINERKSNK